MKYLLNGEVVDREEVPDDMIAIPLGAVPDSDSGNIILDSVEIYTQALVTYLQLPEQLKMDLATEDPGTILASIKRGKYGR